MDTHGQIKQIMDTHRFGIMNVHEIRVIDTHRFGIMGVHEMTRL